MSATVFDCAANALFVKAADVYVVSPFSVQVGSFVFVPVAAAVSVSVWDASFAQTRAAVTLLLSVAQV